MSNEDTVWHLAGELAFRPACGANNRDQHTTDELARVNCPDCLATRRPDFLGVKSPARREAERRAEFYRYMQQVDRMSKAYVIGLLADSVGDYKQTPPVVQRPIDLAIRWVEHTRWAASVDVSTAMEDTLEELRRLAAS